VTTRNATAEQILDAAEKRVRVGGYDAMSFRDLADDVAVKSASVHYHFPAKSDLGVALVERYRARFFEELAARTGSAAPRQKLVAFVSLYRDALDKGGAICLCGMLGAESGGLPEVVARTVRGFFEANIAWVRAALEEGALSDAANDDATLFVATLQGALILSASLDDLGVYDAAARRILQPFRV
jgi:TetR/AcrR family transcriptional repressor of nem operon